MDKINFENKPSTKTPINATNLNKMQDNIEKAIENLEYGTITGTALNWVKNGKLISINGYLSIGQDHAESTEIFKLPYAPYNRMGAIALRLDGLARCVYCNPNGISVMPANNTIFAGFYYMNFSYYIN